MLDFIRGPIHVLICIDWAVNEVVNWGCVPLTVFEIGTHYAAQAILELRLLITGK